MEEKEEGTLSASIEEEDVKNGHGHGHVSPSSSPPTPPSPLPISVGPGNQKYFFSPSPSPSPPFSPPHSSHTSAENLPLLDEKFTSVINTQVPSAFSLDRPRQHDDELDSKGSTCLVDLLEWFIERCCSCCSKSSNRLSNTMQMQES